MDWEKEFGKPDEKPLDRFADGISNTAIFRRIAFIGDSLSSGEFETLNADGSRGYHDLYEYSWGQYIARKNGLTAYNFSRGGMTAKWYLESFADERGLWDIGKACQAYVIALGVNDLFNQNQPVGSIDDIDPEDSSRNKPTFMGLLARIVSRYKTIQPDAKFFFVTVPNGGDDSVIAKQHRDAMYALAEYFDNSYVIDLYQYGPVYNNEFKERFYLHGHLNASGYILTARMVDSYIDYIIRHNPDDFRNAALIGSGIKY